MVQTIQDFLKIYCKPCITATVARVAAAANTEAKRVCYCHCVFTGYYLILMC